MIIYVTVIAFCLMEEPCRYYVGDTPYESETVCIAAAKTMQERFTENLRKQALQAGHTFMPAMKIGHGCKQGESA